MKYTFPVFFKEDKDDPGYIIISFPDLLGIGSECLKGEEIKTAKEVLELALSSSSYRRSIEPTAINKLKEVYPDQEMTLITVDID